MTDHPEHEPSVPPAPRQFNDGWWDAIIDAVLQEYEEPEETLGRGPGR